jgi:hypothetical protein
MRVPNDSWWSRIGSSLRIARLSDYALAYAGAHTPSGKQSLFVGRFREAFAVAGMVYDDLEPPEIEGFSVVRPGFLRSNS